MESYVDSGESNYAFLSLNGDQQYETSHYTGSDGGNVRSTGGRVDTLEISAGDQIDVRTSGVGGTYYHILYCAEYISKM